MKNKKIFGLILLVFTVILSISYAKAWGVASYYTEAKPLVLAPGANGIAVFSLQNMIGDSDIKVLVKVIDGADIAQIIGPTEYIVPIGNHDTQVQINVTAPEKEGEYSINLLFETVATGTGQGVQMETAMEKKFTVLSSKGASITVTQPTTTATEAMPYWVIIVVVVIIAAGAIVIISTRKKKQGQKKK